MKILSTKIHGVLDYLVSIFLVVSPWLLSFNRGGSETWVPVVLGVSSLGYSLLTKYEYGVIKILPMKLHLLLDLISGMLLSVSPWLFNFSDDVYLPHLIIGVMEIVVSLITVSTIGSIQNNYNVNPSRRP